MFYGTSGIGRMAGTIVVIRGASFGQCRVAFYPLRRGVGGLWGKSCGKIAQQGLNVLRRGHREALVVGRGVQ